MKAYRAPFVLTPAVQQIADVQPVRESIRVIAQRLHAIEYQLDNRLHSDADVLEMLRHSDLPFALDEYLAAQLRRSAS